MTSPPEKPYRIPDFAADAATIARYDAVVKQVVLAAIAEANRELRETFDKARLGLEEAKRIADNDLKKAEAAAFQARVRYSRLVPKQRTASGIVRPPTFFFDTLLTAGAANKCYDEALQAAKARNEIAARQRAVAAQVAALTTALESAIVKRELQVREHFKSTQGLSELQGHPELQALANQRHEIELERADYVKRLAAKEISDAELRDRSMAESMLHFLDGELHNLQYMRGRDLSFGRLRYATFRDRDDRLFLLDNAVDLEPLARITFDIVPTKSGYLVSRVLPLSEQARNREDPKRRGPDPRAGLGVDPELLQALREFLERERTRV